MVLNNKGKLTVIKSVFFDIDGTLVSFITHKMPSSAITALKKLRDSGVKLFIASGRHRVSMDKLEPYLYLFDGLVQVNGGLCTYKDKVIYRHTLETEDVKTWLDYIEDNPHSTCFVLENRICMNYADENMEKVFSDLDFPRPETVNLRDFQNDKVYQLLVSFEEKDNDKVLPIFPNCYAPRWHSLFSDIIPNGVNKLNGIKKVLDILDIDIVNAAAFGDGGNDMEMISGVGFGVAMGDARESLKEIADLVTDTVENDGLYNAVDYMYKKGMIEKTL